MRRLTPDERKRIDVFTSSLSKLKGVVLHPAYLQKLRDDYRALIKSLFH